MGGPTGFLEVERCETPYRGEEERLRDFRELHLPQEAEERKRQASRCMNCGVPFCQSDFGCPLHNRIPEWNDLLFQGQERLALERLLQTAPFPEFTGRVCPGLCEKACNLADAGVTCRDNELYLIEKGFEEKWIQPRIPRVSTQRKVVVAGSGPAGLAAADLLNQLGHDVTVLERADRPGGLLMYGIPCMKLPKSVLERRIRLMEAEGITFRLGTEASPEEVAGMDAVVLCCGSGKPRPIQAEHIESSGVWYAVNYLTEVTRSLLTGKTPGVTARDLHVVVVGGGDTGNDCVGTALRQGCASVIQLEMMPEPPDSRTAGNPWPEWPRVLRTDYGQREAAFRQGKDPRIYETTVKRVLPDAEGVIREIETVRVAKSGDGRMLPVPGTEQILPCGLLLIAAGFIGCEDGTLERFSLSADRRGRLLPADGTHYLGGRFFSAGDMRTGPSLVVRSLADGRAAALEADAWLKRG